MGPTKPAVFFKLQFSLGCSLVLRRCVVPVLALTTGQRHNDSHSTLLLDDFADNTGAHRAPTLSDGEA